MGSKHESLNKRVRETVPGLPDEDLLKMTDGPSYTPFARRVAWEEVLKRRRAKAAQTDPSDAVVVDPGAFRQEPPADKRHGCYIELWSEKQFEGECLRIEGPVECEALDSISLEWSDTASSLRVGPSAFALVYAGKGFEGAMLSVGPGQEVADLEGLRFDNEIGSIDLVSSLKIFDGLRMQDAEKPAAECLPQKKRSKKVKQPK